MECLTVYKITPKLGNQGLIETVWFCDDGMFYLIHERKINQRTVYVTERLLENEVDELFNQENNEVKIL